MSFIIAKVKGLVGKIQVLDVPIIHQSENTIVCGKKGLVGVQVASA
jgi:hypothetical protein